MFLNVLFYLDELLMNKNNKKYFYILVITFFEQIEI